MGGIKFNGSVTLDDPSTLGHFLWRLGHFHSPDYPTGIDPLDPEEAISLKLNSEPMQAAVMSYMEWFEDDLDVLVRHHHAGRHLDKNGEAGPAFVELANEPRCGYPDYMAAGKQEANWPDSCRRDLIFGRSFKAAPNMSEADTDKAFVGACFNISRAIADIVLKSQGHGPRGSARIYADLKLLRGSTLAWSYLARNRCADVLAQAYNTLTKWYLKYLCTVGTHELIHATGGPHVKHRDATMYPSIHPRSLERYGYLHAADLSMMESIGYTKSGLGQPTLDELFSGTTPDPPKPEPPTGGVILKGTTTVYIDGKAVGDFIFTPKTAV